MSTGSWIQRWIRVPFRTASPEDVVDVLIAVLQSYKQGQPEREAMEAEA